MGKQMFKIKLTGNTDLIKKAKKLVYVGLSRADGVALYSTMSYDSKEGVEAYLDDLKITYESVQKLSAVKT